MSERGKAIPLRERGAALLTVLLLVAVMAAIAALTLDRLTLATRLAVNAAAIDRARFVARAAETLAVDEIKRRVDENRTRTVDVGGWLGQPSTIPYQDAVITARVFDGGNCFNINSLVEGNDNNAAARPVGITQFVSLMRLIGIRPGDAIGIADATADWIDSDTQPLAAGAEDDSYALSDRPRRTANRPMLDVSELAEVRGVTPDIYAQLEPWLCALPSTDLSPINVNTLRPEQAPLLAMLAPDIISLARARDIIERRPALGWSGTVEFWRPFSERSQIIGPQVQGQVQVRTRWFRLSLAVAAGDVELTQESLVDAQVTPARVVSRRWPL